MRAPDPTIRPCSTPHGQSRHSPSPKGKPPAALSETSTFQAPPHDASTNTDLQPPSRMNGSSTNSHEPRIAPLLILLIIKRPHILLLLLLFRLPLLPPFSLLRSLPSRQIPSSPFISVEGSPPRLLTPLSVDRIWWVSPRLEPPGTPRSIAAQPTD